jgi:signal transduction histidine kinase
MLARVVAGRTSESRRVWIVPRSDAEPVPVEVACTTHERGARDSVLWSLRDVRERLRADRLQHVALERDRRDVQEYADRLHRLEQAKSNFLDLASHELRAPMTVVRGYVSMIAEGSLGRLSAEVGGAVAVIAAKLEEMNRLVSQMLETARVDDDRQMMSRQPLDLRALLVRAMESLRPQASQRGQRIALIVPDGAVTVEADPTSITTVIVNLVENALKYSPGGSEVSCRLELGDSEARVAVIDCGPGVDPASLEELFSRFGRVLKPETEHVAGTGLGLYLAREMARRHGGDVTVERNRAQGSTFVLALPLAGQAAE